MAIDTNIPPLTIEQIESILGQDAALVLQSIQEDVQNTDMYSDDQVLEDYTTNVPILLEYLVTALRRLSAPTIGEVNKPELRYDIKQMLDSLEQCLSEAPVDFLGTGYNSKLADQEFEEWTNKWESSLAYLREVLALAPFPVIEDKDGWVLCDGKADYQAEEEWVWVAIPSGEVAKASWKEAHWEDEELWVDAVYSIPGHEGQTYKTPRFVWAVAVDEDGSCETLDPQPTHFQPKPSAPQYTKKGGQDGL